MTIAPAGPAPSGSDHCDVIVIDSGTTPTALAATGNKVLVLERADYLPRERDNWESKAGLGTGNYALVGVSTRGISGTESSSALVDHAGERA